MKDLTEAARIALAAAQELRDGESCFVGIGIPSDAALLARRSHAPGLTLIYEAGVFGADPPRPPLSTGSPEVAAGAAMVADGLTAFGELQAGRISCAILSAAQMDRFGSLNSTVIGPYATPALRLVGSGGAHDIACLARRLVLVMPHDPRRFVETVDFATSPGAGPPLAARRAALGLGPGPSVMITGRGRFVMSDSGWQLAATFPGFDIAGALEGLPWGRPEGSVPALDIPPAAVSALGSLPHLAATSQGN